MLARRSVRSPKLPGDDLLAESQFDGVEEEIESVVRVVESIISR